MLGGGFLFIRQDVSIQKKRIKIAFIPFCCPLPFTTTAPSRTDDNDSIECPRARSVDFIR